MSLKTAKEILEKIDKCKQDKSKGFFQQEYDPHAVLEIINLVFERVQKLMPYCFTTDNVLSLSHRGRWITLTEKAIKYSAQCITALCKEINSPPQQQSQLTNCFYKLRFVMYLFDIIEQGNKIDINVTPEHDESVVDMKKYHKMVEKMTKALQGCQGKDKKKISKASEHLKKLETNVFTRISKKKQQEHQPLIETHAYLKELNNFRGLVKAQLDMVYRDNSNEEPGVNYSNVLIEGYAITFPFKNKRIMATDVMGEFMFSLFDCQTDDNFKNYPKDPCDVEQTLMNLVFFWYVNYNEDFQTFKCQEIMEMMNEYCIGVFDLECVNLSIAKRKIETTQKGIQTKMTTKQIKLFYINENIVADIMTEIDTHLYFQIPFSTYLQEYNEKELDNINNIQGMLTRQKKYEDFVSRLCNIDFNDSYQFFCSLASSLVYRCHNFFAAYVIYTQLSRLATNQSGFNIESFERNVKNQTLDLDKLFPKKDVPGDSSNFECVKALDGCYICHPQLMITMGNKYMTTVRTNLQFKSNLPSEDVNNLNEFTKRFEQSYYHFSNRPKVRAESTRPILGFDLLEYLCKLPKTEGEETTLKKYDKPNKFVVRKMTREEKLKKQKEMMKIKTKPQKK